MTENNPPHPEPRRIDLYAALAGFGLAGLFDSILLHRILNWHHLLTASAPKAGIDLHLRVDGLFDAAMYAALIAGLIGLFIDRRALARLHPRCGTGMVLIGFGLWHLTDAVLVHWILGLHRIRPGAQSPLLWDIGWLVSFGLLPLLIGLTLRKTTALPAPD